MFFLISSPSPPLLSSHPASSPGVVETPVRCQPQHLVSRVFDNWQSVVYEEARLRGRDISRQRQPCKFHSPRILVVTINDTRQSARQPDLAPRPCSQTLLPDLAPRPCSQTLFPDVVPRPWSSPNYFPLSLPMLACKTAFLCLDDWAKRLRLSSTRRAPARSNSPFLFFFF